RFFPRPAELWSSLHPYLATASLCLSTHRTAPLPPATISGIRPRRPTAGSGHGPWSGDRGPWRPRRPTDSRCAARKRWHRHTADRACVACLRQTGGCSCAWGLSAAALSTVLPTRETLSLLYSPAPAGAACGSVPCPYLIKSGLSG